MQGFRACFVISWLAQEEVETGGEAEASDQEHSRPGDEVDAAFGYRADPTLLAPSTTQQSVGAKGETGQPGEDQQYSESRQGRHPNNPVRCSYRLPCGRGGCGSVGRRAGARTPARS